MPHFKGNRIIRHPVERVFRLALNLEQYPHMLSYIKRVSILERDENKLIADISLGLLSISFSYRCEVIFSQNEKITVTSDSNLFKGFRSECIFKKIDDQTTQIFYELDANFKTRFLEIPAKIALPIHTLNTINTFEKYLSKSV